jgi:hypothetical protein
LTPSSRSIKKYCKKQIQKGKKKLMSVGGKIVGEESVDIGDSGIHIDNREEENYSVGEVESFASTPGQWGEKFFVPTTGTPIGQSLGTTDKEEEEHEETDNEKDPAPQLLLEFLGGVDNRTEGIVIDGDEFFDSEAKLVESEDERSDNSSRIECFADPLSASPGECLAVSDSWSLDIHEDEAVSAQKQASDVQSNDDSNSENGPVVLEETPLPRMFVPGKVVHMYSYRGIYKASYVPRTFRELRRISLAGNMLSNHTVKSYYEGLLEVQTARAAPESPPIWTAFDEDDTW